MESSLTITYSSFSLRLLYLTFYTLYYPHFSARYLLVDSTLAAPPPPIIAPPTPKGGAPHAYPQAHPPRPHSPPPVAQQTFWIPFTLAPGSTGTGSGVGRLTPINRRVPPHLRAAASALNIKMTYTRNGAGEYVYTQSQTPAPGV